MAEDRGLGEPKRGKSILLFSDGTGNSSGKLFKTNVWRTYEAADLGPPPPGLRPQIAFYDDGVGTSWFRPLAILGGIFGIGLKRNVLDLYRFACRNYTPGDTIYAFGFSRGAFTIRLVIALIASQGLVPADTEAALRQGTADAWRAYRRRYLPRRLQWPTKLWRAAHLALIHALRRPEDRYRLRRNRRPEIRFVGVWDTVAAYGGPSVEITRAIDNWLYPLSMPNYALSKRVGRARHALALDDERDAFHPLVWDELAERELIVRGLVREDRLRQFWFTGMHADVGGGYPDESLSYVSLLWMLEEAQKAGLRTLDVITDRHRALANSAGPIHDSRAGLGSYYRYLPRRIDALLDPPAPETRLTWPPERRDGRGLLTAARIHESALARIIRGTDRYAPITIPETFEIHPPQRAGENVPQPASGADARSAPDRGDVKPLLSAADVATLRDAARKAARTAMMPAIWDLVWWRRVGYFATVLVTAALASMPLWPAPAGMEPWCDDSRCLLPGLFSPLKAVLPGAASPWIDRYTAQPVTASALLVLLVVGMMLGGRMGGTIRARSAAAWRCVLDGTPAAPDRGGVARAIRCSALWLGTLRFLKWRLLPGLAAVAVLVALAAVPLALPMQWWLAKAERDGTLCHDPGARPDANAETISFAADQPCTDLRRMLKPHAAYAITLQVTRQWCDGGLAADPVRGATGGWWLTPLRFHRRVTSANWLKPVAIVRRPDSEDGRVPGAKVRIDPLDFDYLGAGRYRARLIAPAWGGQLYLALNDAAPPFRPELFYANNTGAAVVTITEERAPSCREDGCAIALPPPPAIACGARVAR
ncbi:T6SS phospholipase effector Tle1-like catalytic domain-containing protein [Sphingomonas sp. 8AM]|uniref:T6SS phospholipase effector Tle1-like catalytic domain-containing protein n=1 Tax=Sphingomonas sp. 8AM TaxID=2653170 RepID=UPI001356AEDC|nr:DUF2235 domain-containing protein [Sphingomonas sp. 8AM]